MFESHSSCIGIDIFDERILSMEKTYAKEISRKEITIYFESSLGFIIQWYDEGINKYTKENREREKRKRERERARARARARARESEREREPERERERARAREIERVREGENRK